MSEVPDRLAQLSPERRVLLEKLMLQRAAAGASRGRLRRREGAGPAPLSFAQQRLWFIDHLDPGSSAYNMPVALRLRGPLDVRVMERTLTEVVRRHEALRTTFAEVEGEARQVVHPASAVRLDPLDLSHLPGGEREAEALRRAAEDARRPFDLRRGPLFHARLLRLAPDEHVLVLSMHHVVSDGWSTGVLLREVAALYEAFARGGPSPLPEPPVQYADFAAWQREWLSGAVLQAQLDWWRERLAGAPALLDVPLDRPRPATPGARAASVFRVLTPAASAGLRALAAAEGATLFMVLLAALDVLLARWSGQDDVVVGTPIANRNRVETEGLVGFFVNTLPLRADLSGDPPFRALVRRVRETTLGAYQHQDLPFERLVEALEVERSLSHTPLFQVFFSVSEAGGGPRPFAGLEVELFPTGTPAAKFDLAVAVTDAEPALAVALTWREELWDASTMERAADAVALLLEAAAADPDRRIGDLPLAPAAERGRILREWSPGPAAPAPVHAVHELVALQAARTPDALAVSFADRTLTYAELEAHAGALAARLRALGVAPEARVGICLERSAGSVVAVLAVMKAGGAYVPLDPAQPDARLAAMLADSGARVLVAEPGLRERFAGFGGEVVAVEGTPLPPAPSPARGEGENDSVEVGVGASPRQAPTPGPSPNAGGGENDSAEGASSMELPLPRHGGGWRASSEPGGGALLDASASDAVPPSPLAGEGPGEGGLSSLDRLAYVVYTSGSTGTPKGVLVSHRSLAASLLAARDTFGFAAGETVPVLASPAFDIWAFEALLPLTLGATVRVLPRETVQDVAALAPELERVDALHAVPALMREVALAAREGRADLSRLRRAFVGGDAVPPELLGAMRDAFPDARLHVLYGPTEGTIICASHPVPAEGGVSRQMLGAPLPGASLYVLDGAGGVLPAGMPGELCVGGAGVARGYLGRPELTAERFVPDALSGAAGGRLYRTGDRARWLPDGTLEFLGRTDQQVKVRGFRIEPGEIEAALLAHPLVREAAVVVREDAPGERRLVGYVVPAEGAETTPAELRGHLLERLPDYMVPAAFVALEKMPLAATGKVDRKALPAPERGEGQEYVAPRTAAEELVAQVWAEVLGVERVGVHDGFFDLGGHSLLAMRVSSRLREMKLEVPVRLVFQAPTLEALVREVVAREPRPGLTEKVAAAVLKLRSLAPEARERMLRGREGPAAPPGNGRARPRAVPLAWGGPARAH